MSIMRFVPGAVVLIGAILAATPAVGQGVQTATISGIVRSSDTQPLPGVGVTATSAQLQGERTAVSDANGVYQLRGLPPGVYRVTLTIPGFQTQVRDGVAAGAGDIVGVDADLAVAGITESVVVSAPTPSPIQSPVVRQTYGKNEIDTLPIGRRPADVGELAAGVTTNVFNAAQLTIAGSFGFDNVFMVNGVDVNDNVQGTFNNLFIEDAIQEVAVLAHGIPAEYGRFSGGVINVVTRSGGNSFSGSFREGFGNPSWVEETPLQKATSVENPSLLSTTHEGTFGGPVVKNRLWFFGAARREHANTASTFAQAGGGYTRTDTNTRAEGKMTATVAPSHTMQATFIDNATRQSNTSAVPAAAILDPRMLITRTLPNRLFGASYMGVLGRSVFTSLQYSEKVQRFDNNGGAGTDLVNSPFRTRGATTGVPAGLFYGAPYLDASDPEQRNNRQIAGSASYLLTTPRVGSHDLKGGAEHFVSTGIGGNSQSPTGYVFVTDYVTANGVIVRDADGSPIPRFIPGVTQVWNFQATRGAQIDIRTTSAFVQDRWFVSPRLTVDLGARVEVVRSTATGDPDAVSGTTIVPRLAASYALDASGATVVTGSYGHYAGKYGQVQFGVNTNVTRPSEVDYSYSGPAGQGREFAPGFDLANYRTVTFASFPTANVRLADGITSPVTREFTAGVGRELPRGGHAKATYAWRRATGFVEDFVNMANGTTVVPSVGTLTNRVYDNTDDLEREYRAAIFDSRYRVLDALTVSGHYTLQLRNHGNYAGEAANQPGVPSIYGNFPEIYGPALDRLMPYGRLDNYQRHKLRVFATYTQPLGRFGSLDLSPLWRVNSGGVYSLTTSVNVTAQELARNPGYATTDISASTRQTVFFGTRGEFELPGYGVMDFATSYSIAAWKSVQPWFKVEVYNLFNNQKLIGWDRTVTADTTSPRDPNGLPTGYVQGPRFGQGTAGNHYPQPWAGQNGGRAIRFAFGARF